LEHGLNELWCFIPFCLVYFTIPLLCYHFRNKPHELFAVENVWAHLAAFIGVEMFDEPLEHIAEVSGAGTILFLASPVLAFGLFFGLAKAATLLSKHAFGIEASHSHGHGEKDGKSPAEGHAPEHAHPPESDGHAGGEHGSQGDHGHADHGDHAHHHTWDHCVMKAQAEVSAIVCGFLIKNLGEDIADHIGGESEAADVHTLGSVAVLIVWTAMICGIYCAVVHYQDKIVKYFDSEDIYEKIQDHLCFAVAWCVAASSTHITYWCVETESTNSPLKSLTVRKMVNALWVTPAMVAVILFMDRLADMCLFTDAKAESISSCCGLITGIAWEKCYQSGARTVAEVTPMHDTLVQVILGFGLVAALVPGWLKFIVPKATAPMPERALTKLRRSVEGEAHSNAAQEASSGPESGSEDGSASSPQRKL